MRRALGAVVLAVACAVALGPARAQNVEPAAPVAPQAQPAAPAPAAPDPSAPAPAAPAPSAPAPAAPAPAAPAPAAPAPAAPAAPRPPRIRIALHEVAAFGTTRDAFINATAGLRVDYRFTPALALGTELAYANLEGDNERAQSYLIMLQAEALALLEGTPLSVPVRVGLGHMKRNGLVLRVATGISWSIARRLDLVLEVVPTFWTTPRGVYPSVGPGLELSIGL